MAISQTDEQREVDRQRFLAEASHLLSSTLDYTETLQRLAQLAVPRMADWCAIYIADVRGVLQPVEIAHEDQHKLELGLELRRRFPTEPSDGRGPYHVLRTGRSEFVREISDAILRDAKLAPDQVDIIKRLGVRSMMTVPLRARGRTFGVIQFVSAQSGRLFDNEDVAFAEDLALRAAFAVDNARLFQSAKKRQKEEAALRRATEAVTATFSVDEIIDQIARSALEATDADGSCVERFIDGEVFIVAVGGTLHPEVGARMQFEVSVAQRILVVGLPEVIMS